MLRSAQQLAHQRIQGQSLHTRFHACARARPGSRRRATPRGGAAPAAMVMLTHYILRRFYSCMYIHYTSTLQNTLYTTHIPALPMYRYRGCKIEIPLARFVTVTTCNLQPANRELLSTVLLVIVQTGIPACRQGPVLFFWILYKIHIFMLRTAVS